MTSLSERILAAMSENESTENDEKSEKNFERTTVEFTLIPGFRKNSKIIWTHDQQFLYYFNSQSEKTGIKACTCYDENCNARLYIMDESTAFSNLTPHNHGSHYEVYIHMYCYNLLKQKTLSAPASVSNKDIYNEVIKEYV